MHDAVGIPKLLLLVLYKAAAITYTIDAVNILEWLRYTK